MIIHDLDLVGPFVAPSKHDSPLIVDSDRMLAGKVSSQCFQWRRQADTIAGHRTSSDAGGDIVMPKTTRFDAADYLEQGRELTRRLPKPVGGLGRDPPISDCFADETCCADLLLFTKLGAC
jgi:hypothetical protein